MTHFSPRALHPALLLLAISPALGQTVTQLMRDPLEGKWIIDATPDDDARQNQAHDFHDTLVFKANSFSSEFLKKHGFGDVPYDEDTRPGGVGGFKVAQISKTDEGKAKWEGFVAATEISGTLIWTKKDGTALNYSFRGSKS